ncbi:hypothetical protein [Pseudonocardia sp.]|uniref:hypothetical protein n=1 Tax=Pseudonocardia sp. TaxID=60912 RepID=UPI0026399ABB|nr:hypothetical protein [Pseudonocardia sp.]
MAWLLAQVWVLCAVAFLLGAGVTWLLFVRPRQRPMAGYPGRSVPPHEPGPGPDLPQRRPQPEMPSGPAVDPALSALDGTTLGMPPVPRVGTRASGALDLLGVARREPPDIPRQPGPDDRA